MLIKTKIFLPIFIHFIFISNVYSQTVYSPQGIGGGGAMSSFSMSPSDKNLWLVATDMGTIFRSLDQGESWLPVDHGQVQYSSNLNLSSPFGFCGDPNIILFAKAGKRVYRTTDQGATWMIQPVQLNELEMIKYWLVHSENESILFCATDERLLRSHDKGLTFQSCNITGPSMGTFIDYVDGILYHATDQGIYRSDDLGDSFYEYHVPDVLPLHCFTGGRDDLGLTLAYIDGNGTDAVEPWIQAYLGLVDGSTETDYNYSVSTSGFVWIKKTGAEAFQRISHHQTYDRVTIESEYLYGGGNTRLIEDIYDVPRDQVQPGGLYMAENNSQVIYVTGNKYWPRMYGNKTWVSVNGGQSFEKRFHGNDWDNGYIPWPADKLEHSAVGLEVGWHDGYFENFYVNQTDASMAGGTGWYFLHVTKDTAKHWLAPFTEFADTEPRTAGKRWRSTGLEVTGVHQIQFHPTNPQLMYAGLSDIGGYMSEDGGQSVRMCDAGYNTIYQYAFDPNDDQVVYSANSGTHGWPTMWYYTIIQGTGGIFKSLDRGRNWIRLTPDDEQFNRSFLSIAYDPQRNILYAGSHGAGIARSTDGGNTWSYFNAGIPEGNGRIIPRITLDGQGDVYALLTGDYISSTEFTNTLSTGVYFLDVVKGATHWRHLRGTVHVPSENAGETESRFWRYPTDFAVHPQDSTEMWLVEYERGGWLCAGIWKSTDRGENWHRVRQYTHPIHILIDPVTPEKVFVSGFYDLDGGWGDGGLMYTNDGGATWHKNQRVPYQGIGMCAAIDPNRSGQIWYGFYGAGLLHGSRPDAFANAQMPTAPPNLIAENLTAGAVSLTWEESTSDSPIKGYRIVVSGSGIVYPAIFTPDRSYTFSHEYPETWHAFRVQAIDSDGDWSPFSETASVLTLPDATGVKQSKTDSVNTPVLQLYPNPANNTVTFSWRLPPDQKVLSLRVYNIIGQMVQDLTGRIRPGQNRIVWDGVDERGDEVTSGVYFVLMKGLKFSRRGKIIFIK